MVKEAYCHDAAATPVDADVPLPVSPRDEPSMDAEPPTAPGCPDCGDEGGDSLAEDPTDARPQWQNALLCIVVVGFGMLEGASFHRSGIFLPEAIGGQMVFKVWIVLKLFIAAVGSSMLFQGIMKAVLTDRFEASRRYKTRSAGIVRVVVGSCLLGSGMALSGVGPTMLPAQVGAGVRNSWATVIGAFAAGIAFALLQKVFPAALSTPAADPELKVVVDRLLPVSYHAVAIPAGVAMVGVAIGLEFVVRQSHDEEVLGEGRLPWYPTIAGVIIGFNQVPLRLIAGHGQGGTTSIMTVLSTVTCGFLSPVNRVTSFKQVWQFAFVWVGTLLGSLASAQINASETFVPQGYNIGRSVIGGFLMVFGPLISGGCTCGHAISGFSELSMISMIAACCIFGAGIATGFIVEAAGFGMCCHQQP